MPYNERRINKRNTTRSLITRILPVGMQGTQENQGMPTSGQSRPQMAKATTLNNHLQLKTKEVLGSGEPVTRLGEGDWENAVNKGRVVLQI